MKSEEAPWWLVVLAIMAVAVLLAVAAWLLDELYWVMRCAFGR